MTPLPLRSSLTLLYGAMLAILVTAVAAGYHQLVIRQLEQDATTDAEERERGLRGYLRVEGGQAVLTYDRQDPEVASFVDEATRFYQIFDANSGQLLVQSPGLASLGIDYTQDEIQVYRSRLGWHDVRTDRGRLRIISGLITPTPDTAYLLQVGVSLDRVDRSIAALEIQLAWGLGAGVLASLLIGRWMSGRALAPLSRLARATRRIDIHTLSQRLPVRGAHDELDDVTEAFNQTLARVEHSVGEMRQFSTALAHELRTPLAILRGETELALTQEDPSPRVRQRLESQLEEFDRLNRLIADILTLARAESGQVAMARTTVDLAPLVRTVGEDIAVVAVDRGLTLTCNAAESVVVSADPTWIRRLLLILLDNALKFTPAGGHIAVSVTRTGDEAHLDVRDTGTGIPADALPHVFEPFYRVDTSRSRQTEGTGLGLALARWIADQHQARIDVRSAPGQGSTFSVRLPLRH